MANYRPIVFFLKKNRVYRTEREDDDWVNVITSLLNDDDDDTMPSAGSAKQSESNMIKYDYARTAFARGGFSHYLMSRR